MTASNSSYLTLSFRLLGLLKSDLLKGSFVSQKLTAKFSFFEGTGKVLRDRNWREFPNSAFLK